MSRIASPQEKILAFGATYKAVRDEVDGRVDTHEPRVQAALIEVAIRIAMSTDTRSLGPDTILGMDLPVEAGDDDPGLGLEVD